MRLLALLLSFYVICLSCLPCTDEVPGRVEAARTQTSISAAAHADGGHHLGDWCSPLCQCHCCAGAVVASFGADALSFASPAPRWFTSFRHAALLVGVPTHAPAAVWQPPQA